MIACVLGACSRSSDPLGSTAPESAPPEKAGQGGAAPTASSTPLGKPESLLTVVASGSATGVRLESDVLTFCDKRGGRMLDLASGVESARERQCPQNEELNTTCEGLGVEVTVRTPGGGPDDIVDLEGSPSFPMHGRIHDCAIENNVFAIATGQNVVTIDVKAQRSAVVYKSGGERVAINGAWIAWTNGAKVYAKRR